MVSDPRRGLFGNLTCTESCHRVTCFVHLVLLVVNDDRIMLKGCGETFTIFFHVTRVMSAHVSTAMLHVWHEMDGNMCCVYVRWSKAQCRAKSCGV